MKRQAADQAATASEFILFASARLGEGGRGWGRLIGDVPPTQGVLVVQGNGRVRVTRLRDRPRAAALNEKGPVGSARGKAFVVLGRLVVDLADGFPETKCLRLERDAGLVHQGLTVDGVTGEPDAFLHCRARGVLDHYVGAMCCACIDTRARRACGAGAW